MTNTPNTHEKIKKMTVQAVFCALAYICVFLFRLKVGFLTFDIKDAVITICAMLFGPVSAIAVSAVVSVIEFLTVSDTGIYGLLMNVISSIAFSFPAACIYQYRRTLGGAMLSLLAGVCSMTVLMLGANLLVTPFYSGVPVSAVIDMIPSLLLPFNLIKAMFNAGVVLLLYKPISTALHARGLLAQRKTEHNSVKPRINPLIPVIVGVVILFGSAILFFIVLGGKIELPFLNH